MSVSTEIVRQYHPTVPAGELISQDPAAGEPIDPNGTVTLYYSLGPATPAFVYFSERQSVAVMRMI